MYKKAKADKMPEEGMGAGHSQRPGYGDLLGDTMRSRFHLSASDTPRRCPLSSPSPWGPRGPQRLPFRFILPVFPLPTYVWTRTQRTQEPHSVSRCGTSRSTWVLVGGGEDWSWLGGEQELGEGDKEKGSQPLVQRRPQRLRSLILMFIWRQVFQFSIASVTKYHRYSGLK